MIDNVVPSYEGWNNYRCNNKKTPTSILEVGAKLMLYFIMNLHVKNKIINFLICAVIFYRFVTIFLQKQSVE